MRESLIEKSQIGPWLRKLLRTGLGVYLMTLAGLAAREAAAQGYPSKQIRFIVPFAAGSAPDNIARMVGQRMEQTLGQPVIIDNKPGANGSIGAGEAARAAPDGYTIFAGTSGTLALNPALFKKLPYDAVKDFSPVARLITAALVLVVKPDFLARNTREFVELARLQPNKLTSGYSSPGMQVSNAQLRTLAGVHVLGVPYKGVPQAVTDVLSGQITFTFADYAVAFPHVRGGTLKGLGITALQRTSLMSEMPALAEEIPGFDATVWNGIVVPAGTPREAINRLWEAAQNAMKSPDVIERLKNLGQEPALLGPDEFGKFILAEGPSWASKIAAAGIEPQ
jgi:tripartite-type tricarboxylate transporter receptor subunit TctC